MNRNTIVIKTDKVVMTSNGPFKFDLTLPVGESTALIGANGCGKSTFFSLLKMNRSFYFPETKVSFTSQGPLRVLGELRPIDFLELAEEKDLINSITFEQINFLLQYLGVGNLLERPINALSGGENQLIKLMIGFSMQADLYCLDEPSNNLDGQNLLKLGRLILQWMERGKTFLIIDHDTHFLKTVCKHRFKMEQMASGPVIQELPWIST